MNEHATTIWRGHYLREEGGPPTAPGGWEWVTLIRFVDDPGECRVRVAPENTLPFKPEWYPMSLHGYHRGANVPPEYREHAALLVRDDEAVAWNARLPENGGVFLFRSREERDRFLGGGDE